ncbi:MAG: RNA polymerase sigma factor [Nitrospinota bacterium]
MDLLAVVHRCSRGETGAWEEFLPAFGEIGRRTLRTFRLSEADQEEILSRSLLSLYEAGLRRFHGTSMGELAVYLKRVVRNEALTYVQRRSREVVDEKVGTTNPSEDALSDVPGRLVEEETRRILEEIIAELPRRDKELYLMKMRGLKEREIAEQTGSPPGTIASRISRLIDQIQKRLRERGCLD